VSLVVLWVISDINCKKQCEKTDQVVCRGRINERLLFGEIICGTVHREETNDLIANGVEGVFCAEGRFR
jgi:hypothetical protein